MKASPGRGSIVRFGVFEVDLDECELRRSGLRQKLPPQAFEVLRAMLERPGQLVTREDFRRHIWPEDRFVDYELGLKKCINRIRETLGDSADHPRFIETIPRRGYRFIAPVEQLGEYPESTSAVAASSQPAPPPHTHARRTFRYLLVAAVLILFLAAASAPFFRRHQSDHASPNRPEPVVLPLISLPGEQSMPAFSPDGSRVAFCWRAPQEQQSGIYAAVVGTQSLLRLAEGANAYSPAWSPDGREVAFLRDEKKKFLIQSVPALGGDPRTLYTGPLRPLSYVAGEVGLSFSPDNKLAFSEWNPAIQESAIKLLSLLDSSTRFLTSPPSGYRDRYPAFSPAGDKIAFVRSTGSGVVEDLVVVSTATGELRQVTFDRKPIFGPPTWTPKGDELIFSSNRAGLDALWRIRVSGGTPQRVSGAGPTAWYASISPSGKELAYQHVDEEENLYRLELKDQIHARSRASILVSSDKTYNFLPQFSPDGRKIAFQSGRSGYSEIWICDADGSHLVQATNFQHFAGSARWSPDSRYLAFDDRPHEHSEILVLDTVTGHTHSVAAFPDADNTVPSWSRDGRWVYFTSNRRKAVQIWKAAAKDGTALPAPPVQVTKNGGHTPFESADGKQLFYIKPAEPGIWAMTLDDGIERRVWRGPGPDYWSNWAVTKDGLYFFAPNSGHPPDIQFLDFNTKRVSRIAQLDQPSFFGLTISPDGRSLVYPQWDRNEHDILIMRNFQ